LSGGGFKLRSGRKGPGGEYRLPPALAKLSADPSQLRRDFVEQNQRDRILLAALEVFGTKGSAAATVKELVAEAGVSRATFYKLFADLDACLIALEEEVLDWLGQQAREAAAAKEGDWPGAVTAVTRRLIEELRADSRLARLCGVELLFGGVEVRVGLEAALDQLAEGLRRGRDERPWGKDLPPLLELVLVRGAVSLVATKIVFGTDSSARAVVDELPEVILIAYLGAEDARRAVRSSRPRR
jgi:AcrR family transcriptional regulator